MLAPPGIRFRNPECVEPGLLAGLGHRDRILHGLHAQLQNTDIEWNNHRESLLAPGSGSRRLSLNQFSNFDYRFSDRQSGSFHECSRPLISSHIKLFRGVGIPSFSPHFTIAPFMKSTSVCRLARTSCSMLARCLPGAPAPFCTSWRGSPWSAMPRLWATASPS